VHIILCAMTARHSRARSKSAPNPGPRRIKSQREGRHTAPADTAGCVRAPAHHAPLLPDFLGCLTARFLLRSSATEMAIFASDL